MTAQLLSTTITEGGRLATVLAQLSKLGDVPRFGSRCTRDRCGLGSCRDDVKVRHGGRVYYRLNQNLPVSPKPETAAAIGRERALLAEEMAARLLVANEECGQLQALLCSRETMSRSEVKRSERLHRDLLQSSRAQSFRAIVAPNREKAKTSTEPSAAVPHTGSRPLVSSLQGGPKAKNKRVVVTDRVQQYDLEKPTDECRLSHLNWREIAKYATIKHMVVVGLRQRFGHDGADPDAWVGVAEDYSWLDDFYCDVKDSYQRQHDEECVAWETLMLAEMAQRPASNYSPSQH